MEVKAQLKGLRIAPRKVRRISAVLRGLDAARARERLNHLAAGSSVALKKLLDSALANAQSNFRMVKENMFVKEVIVNEGRKLKRFRPKGFGSASPIEKKTSHITILLAEKVAGLKAEPSKKKEEPELSEAKERKVVERTRREEIKPEVKKEIGKKGVFGGIKGLGRKFFRRKAI
jgi:large subunit ribosomal protein L22